MNYENESKLIIKCLIGVIIGSLLGFVIINELQIKNLKTENKSLLDNYSTCLTDKDTIKTVSELNMQVKEELYARSCHQAIQTILQYERENRLK